MRYLIISCLLFFLQKGFSQSTIIVCNGSFEGPGNSTLPNQASQIPNSTCWDDFQVVCGSNLGLCRSVDWYKFEQYYLEEDVDNDGVFSPISGNRGGGYSGMRVCELLYQKVNIPLKKDIPYVLRFNYRFPSANNRVHQTPTRVFDINPVELRVILSKNKLEFSENASLNCQEVKQCDDLKNKGATEAYNISLSPSLWNTGTWQSHELFFTLNAALNPDFEYLSFIINDNVEGELCDAYLLLDDISIVPLPHCEGEYEGCNGCSFTDGAIGVYTNGENSNIVPLTLFGLSNIQTLTYEVFNSAGQLVVPSTTVSCNNGWLSDSYKITLPVLAQGNYEVRAILTNQCGSCEKVFDFIYVNHFDGVINNQCRPLGLVEPCCEEELQTNNDIYYSDPNGLIVQPINNLYIQNTTVNPGTAIDFKAGNKIEVTQNTTINGDGTVRLFLEECNQERNAIANRPIGNKNETSQELIFEESVSQNEILVYPNPANGSFFIQNNNNAHQVKVYSSTGVLVFETLINPNQRHEISTATFKRGMYVISLKEESGLIINKRVVIY